MDAGAVDERALDGRGRDVEVGVFDDGVDGRSLWDIFVVAWESERWDGRWSEGGSVPDD